MGHVLTQFREGLVVGAIAIGVTVILPLLGVLAFLTRPVFVAAIVGALVVATLLCVFSAEFRHWVDAETEPETDCRGLRLARDVAFHPGHSWARFDRDVIVGADDLAQATLGPVDEVDLPPEGHHVRRGERLFRLRRDDRYLDVPAPVSGTVLGRNESLRGRPRLVNDEPFGRGWVVRLQGNDIMRDRRLLLRGRRARDWFRSEVDRVVGLLASDPAASPVLTNGRVRGVELHRRIDDPAWSRMTEIVFASQPTEPDPRG